ncbi:unnamed protein product [Oikopleura dioica]|uniref:Phospholipase A2-like central domain-containing protein n=1 Tax=Oikopleura dioica TaxID=34765 RepID=E4Z2G7_OIKDI|nr:unnamed protein product [Oikopleura dioica]
MLKFLMNSLALGQMLMGPRDSLDGETDTETESIGFVGARRWNQLLHLMVRFNPEFDEKKYFSYGCNCQFFGDRPMSGPGGGPPMDPLDRTCREYRNCQKCTRMKFGDECRGEFVRYSERQDEQGNFKCGDEAGTCARAICECDLRFAKNHAEKKESYNEEIHSFYSPSNFDDRVYCPANRGKSNRVADRQCCGGNTKPFLLYDANVKSCCDGVVQDGQCEISQHRR